MYVNLFCVVFYILIIEEGKADCGPSLDFIICFPARNDDWCTPLQSSMPDPAGYTQYS